MNILYSTRECGNVILTDACDGESGFLIGFARLRYDSSSKITVGIIENVFVSVPYRTEDSAGKTIDQKLVMSLIEANRKRRREDGEAEVGLLDLTDYQRTRVEYEKSRAAKPE